LFASKIGQANRQKNFEKKAPKPRNSHRSLADDQPEATTHDLPAAISCKPKKSASSGNEPSMTPKETPS
jgi:hypothetical protein